MSRFTKYIKESYYYHNLHGICPDSDDIISDVIGLIEDETDIELSEEDIAQLNYEITGQKG